MAPRSEGELPEVVVVGAACLDVKARLRGATVAGTSNPGAVRISVGGCARNMAENLARLGLRTALISVVCQDDFGRTIVDQTERAGVNTDYMLATCDRGSAAYVALYGEAGQLLVGVDDTEPIAALTPEVIGAHAELLAGARMVVIDANLPLEATHTLLQICAAAGVPVALDTASYGRAMRYRPLIGSFFLVVPNSVEAQALTDTPIASVDQGIAAARQLVAAGVVVAIVTMAEAGLVYATNDSSGYVPAIDVEVVDPTGAGDALTATVVYALLNQIPVDEAVRLGVSAATLTIHSDETVRQDLTLESLYAQLVI
jgi:pseudouridine kinase